jgi:hypothetical protein
MVRSEIAGLPPEIQRAPLTAILPFGRVMNAKPPAPVSYFIADAQKVDRRSSLLQLKESALAYDPLSLQRYCN